MAFETVALIRIDAVWMATEPQDMRSGPETALARVVRIFVAAHPHLAYLFANARAKRMKVLVHDGLGVWLAARGLNSGKFVWGRCAAVVPVADERDAVERTGAGLLRQRMGGVDVFEFAHADPLGRAVTIPESHITLLRD